MTHPKYGHLQTSRLSSVMGCHTASNYSLKLISLGTLQQLATPILTYLPLLTKNRGLISLALEPPSGQLRLNSSDVTRFIRTLLNDLLPRSSRWSSKFHIGGDELNTHAYSLDPTVKSSSPRVLQPLLHTFIDHVISITQSYGIQSIVWEEMALDWNLTLPDSVIVQTWRSTSALASVLAKGHKALFGSSSHWYLDCGFGYFMDPDLKNPNLSDPDRQVKPPYLDYCSPYKNWRHIYSYNPLERIPQEHRHLIVGGEVHLWGELTDSVSLDSTMWPRVAAAAEVMWSGTGKMADEGTTRRLAEFRDRLVAKGVGAGMVQMEWFLRNEGGCTL
jgi:hexosaminidase